MKRFLCLLLAALLVLSCLGWISCGGGGEKTEEATSDEPAMEGEDIEEEDMVESSGEWEDIPIYSGATRHEGEMADRMSATMSGMGDEGDSELRLFKTADEFEKVVSYYRSQMPKQGWIMAVEKEDEGGWNSMWQTKDGQGLVGLTVVKDMEGECGFVISRFKGEK